MKDLILSAGDCERFARTLEALLSPLEDEGPDTWCSSVNALLKDLLGADLASFHLPLPGHEVPISRDVDVEQLRKYPAHFMRFQTRIGLEKRMEELGVWTRETLWGPHIDVLYRSDYWNEYVPAVRQYDTLAATVSFEASRLAGTVYLGHESPKGRKFGRRGEQLMQLLFPAFKAGLLTRARTHGKTRQLATVFDMLRHPMQLADHRGRVVHRNPALIELLRADPERDKLESMLLRFGSAVASHGTRSRRLTELAAHTPVAQTFRTRAESYQLCGSFAPDGLSRGTSVLIAVERVRVAAPALEALGSRFRLTRREAQVARLLAERKTNAEVAEVLGISAHTARHHTERVLGKLEVRSRRQVRSVIARTDEPA